MPAITISAPRRMLSGESARPVSTHRSPQAPDTSLISAVATGDRRAMHTLYTRHSVKVFRFILRIVNNPPLAEDLVSAHREHRTFLDQALLGIHNQAYEACRWAGNCIRRRDP